MNFGEKIWIFPDAELPPKGVNIIPGHESVIILNVGDKDAHVSIVLFYTDREPRKELVITVGANRVRCLRTDRKSDFGNCIPKMGEQYAIMLVSDEPIVAQYGRAESREVNFYTTMGYSSGV